MTFTGVHQRHSNREPPSTVQSISTNTVSNALYLGFNSGSNGTYTLSDIDMASGGLIGNFEFVGYSGFGTFNQTLGTSAPTCTSATWAEAAAATP